ncbi:MAG: alpha/beta fold hydrolase, partial [Rhizobacter sp.]|nr:alpha/beta fold hydrolase [Rhizobacter sp.]
MPARRDDASSAAIEHLTRRVDGVDLHVVAAGHADAPLVVLLHGFPEFWYGWRHQLAALGQAGWRAVAPDQRGYGLSSKPKGVRAYALDVLANDVIALAAALGHRRFTLVGHDWGGIVAWHVASRFPEHV